MCRTVHAVLSTAICGIQMLVRVFMTIILMIENVIRMFLQTLYNFISFLLQMLSLIPICVVFLLTARLKCFMCGGGGPCPVNRGGACDCIMSALAIIILFFIFRAVGVLDKMFYAIGYTKALPQAPARFVPTPGDITECSRNDTDYTDYTFTTIEQMVEEMTYELTYPPDETAFTDKATVETAVETKTKPTKATTKRTVPTIFKRTTTTEKPATVVVTENPTTVPITTVQVTNLATTISEALDTISGADLRTMVYPMI